MRMGKLDGKVAVVTGASSGIGRAAAILFAEEKAKVVAAARRIEAIEETVAIIKAKGGEAIAVQADVTKAADVRNIFTKTIETYVQLDILFNNAGIEQPYKLIHELEEDVWDEVMDTNVKGVYLCMKYGIPHMLERGGVIINTGSPASLIGQPYSPAYCASKAAVLGLTRAAACDYGDRNIRVNCFCPGATETPLFKRVFSGPTFENVVSKKWNLKPPISRFVKPEDMVKAVLFLACDDSTIASGAAFVFDGGFTAT
jgi:NAD(P)-dependent dehydrogenase (short-subunit alcohol dehydrogenase family)